MLLPDTAATGVTHDLISLPSSSTEQAPHCARPQPNLGPCRWSSLCRTYRRGVSRLALTPCVSPFTLILRLFAIPPPRLYYPLMSRVGRQEPPARKVAGCGSPSVSPGRGQTQ